MMDATAVLDSDEEEITSHPITVLWKAWKGAKKKERDSFDMAPHRTAWMNFITKLTTEDNCMDVHCTGRLTKCICMKGIQLGQAVGEDVLSYLIGFSQMKKIERRLIMAEWIRYGDAFALSQRGGRNFLLPGSRHPICGSALARVCGLKSYAWRQLLKAVRNREDLTHGLTGKLSNRRNEEAHEWLNTFFLSLEEQASPRATRLVRTLRTE